MDVEGLYRHIGQLIAGHRFEELRRMDISRPEKINWVRDVFENIHVHDQPNADALIWTDGHNVRKFSFLEIARLCNCYLNFLHKKGLSPGCVIYSQMALLPENWLTMLVSIKGGFRLVPAATLLSIQDIVYRFGKLMPDAVVADEHSAVRVDEAELLLDRHIPLKIIIGNSRKGWSSFETMKEESPIASAADTSADDALFLFFTSGTTGMPKVVTHTHLSYPWGHLSTASWIGLRKGDIHYNISQPGWAKFAWSSFFAPWSVGATVFVFYQKERFNAHEQLSMMEKYEVSTFCAPPTALRMLILEDLSSFKFQLRDCVAAGEPLNPEIIAIWKKGTGMMIRDGYGQTESTCLIANLPGEALKYGSMGKPTFLYDIVIADDAGNELAIHDEGNIAVKTDNEKPNGLFLEYFDDPAKRKEVFRNNLYYTGDKAYRDKDGYIWFVGRDDDVIKTSDYRVGPFEVESVLLEHDAIVESAVVGSPHQVKGFVVKAFVILDQGAVPDEKLAHDIFAFAKKHLASYKVPRVIEFVNELPKTISGKIRRVELRAREAVQRSKKEKLKNEYFL